MRLDLTTACIAGAVILGGLLGMILMHAKRRPPQTAPDKPARRGEDALTFAAAGLATAVAATGMWQFFSDVLKLPTAFLVAMFAFLEVAMFASALRARRNVLEFGKAGADGTAVWALTGLSAVLSATDSHSTKEAALRLAAPLVAAWLWERGMAIERRRQKTSTINWRISPERILIWLGLAEAADRTAADVDAHRRITRLARAAKRLRTLETTGGKPREIRRAIRRVDRAMERAVEHAGLAADPARRQALMDQISALYNAASLATLTPSAPWTATVEHRPSATETAVRDLAAVDALALDNRTRRALGLPPTTPTPRPIVAVDEAPTMARPTTTVRRLTVADAAPSTTTTDDDARRRPTHSGASTTTAVDRRRPTPTTVDDEPTTSPADAPAVTVDDAPATTTTKHAADDAHTPTPTTTSRRGPTTDDWADRTSSLYWDLRAKLGRRPTASEFAAAVDAAGHGQLSGTRAKEVRAVIERRQATDDAPTTADAQTSLTDDGPRINGRVLTARS